jgi:hypothetical protein
MLTETNKMCEGAENQKPPHPENPSKKPPRKAVPPKRFAGNIPPKNTAHGNLAGNHPPNLTVYE